MPQKSDRSAIHLVAATVYVQRDGKLPMRACLGLAQSALFDAENTDARVQRQLDAEEAATAQATKTLTGTVQ